MKPPAQRILIIEDDPDGAEALRLLFELWGYEVEVAHDGARGFALATSGRPDAVVLDLGLPSFDQGCALVRQLRCTLGGDAMLIVAVTGHSRELDRRRALAAGCDVFFLKPADLDQLRQALSSIEAHRESAVRARRR
jgi:CheY-like chemotaxis protein